MLLIVVPVHAMALIGAESTLKAKKAPSLIAVCRKDGFSRAGWISAQLMRMYECWPGRFWVADRKEATRLREFLKWLHRFRFTLKIEFQAGFNENQDR